MGLDVFDHLAALEHPLPAPGSVHPPEMLDEAREEVLRERHAAAEHNREWWSHRWDETDGAGDPVLDAIDTARRQQLEAEARLRLLLAYAREFVEPRPYTLADLAAHAGMSISGVRTAYDTDDEVHQVAERTGLRPRRRPNDR